MTRLSPPNSRWSARGCLSLTFALAASFPAIAEPLEVLTFANARELHRWDYVKAPGGVPGMEYTERFGLNQPYSFKLYTPKWEPGKNEWPTWRLERGFPTDWSDYDRVVMDVVNPTASVQLIGLKVADEATSQLATGNWRGIKAAIPAYSHFRIVQPMSTMMRGILVDRMDQSRIGALLLYATRPHADFHLHISSLFLLKKGDPLPELPEPYQVALRELRLAPLRSEGKAALETLKRKNPEADDLKTAWHAMLARFESIGDAEQLDATASDAAALIRKIRRSESLVPLRARAEAEGYAVAWAASTEKVIPREMPLDALSTGSHAALSVARREAEGVQLVVIPFGKGLEEVEVKAGSFVNEKGEALPEGVVTVSPVGFVRTEAPAYDFAYAGWWPDPLLPFVQSLAIADGDAQSFWIRVRPDAGQAAGVYEGELTVKAKDTPEVRRKLTVRVRDFTLPARPPIPIAIPAPTARILTRLSGEPWERLKYQWADFQADYFLGWDNLYVPQAPDWEVLEHLRSQGRLATFNLYPLGFGGGLQRKRLESGEYRAMLDKVMDKIAPIYEEAKRRNLLEHAYFYGMDEVPTAYLPAVETIAQTVKTRFPGVEIATTATDRSYGTDGQTGAIDSWIPLIHDFNPAKAVEARQQGKKVWWYNCKTPAHPYPNQFIEYPAMDLRIMHGAMSAKYRPDGFLYYSLLRTWSLPDRPPRQLIASGPFTDWDPCALAFSKDERYNGEGYLVYPGPKGTPLASIRLENFRDGLEDLWYWKLLRKQAEQARQSASRSPRQTEWLRKADEALRVPDELVKSSHEFSLDPALLQQWRERIADLIETSPYRL